MSATATIPIYDGLADLTLEDSTRGLLGQRIFDFTSDPFVTDSERVELAALIRLLQEGILAARRVWRLACIYHGADPDGPLEEAATRQAVIADFSKAWINIDSLLKGNIPAREADETKRAKACAVDAMGLIGTALRTDRNMKAELEFVRSVVSVMPPQIMRLASRAYLS